LLCRIYSNLSVKLHVLWQHTPFLPQFALRHPTFWSTGVHFGRLATQFHKLNAFQNARTLLCHLPRLFALAKSLSKSSILPNKGSMVLKSEMSYPKSAIGDLKMGDSHTPSTPMSFRWSSFSVIPKWQNDPLQSVIIFICYVHSSEYILCENKITCLKKLSLSPADGNHSNLETRTSILQVQFKYSLKNFSFFPPL